MCNEFSALIHEKVAGKVFTEAQIRKLTFNEQGCRSGS
jgi:hypothetical protein